MKAPTQSENKERLENLVTALCDIERAEKKGDRDCPELRHRFRKLFGEVLAQLDGVTAPFKKGDLVRLRKGVREGSSLAPLEREHAYRVHEVYYDGEGAWVIDLEETKDRKDRIKFGHHQFERVKITRAA